MRNRARVLTMVAAMAVLGAIGAQGAPGVKANVPFDFVAADRLLPAGAYWFSSDISGVLRITSGDSKQSVLIHSLPADRATTVAGKMLFYRCGSKHFLRSIDSPAARFSVAIPTSRAQREWSRSSMAAMVRVAIP